MRAAGGVTLRLCVVLMSALVVVSAYAGEHGIWGVEALMAARRQVKSASATFVEHKYLRMLMQRIESSGTLRYEAPDWMQKITTKPTPETFELRGDTVSSIQRDGQRFTAALGEHPEIAALVEAMRSTLAGDLVTLLQHYTVEFQGNRDSWHLHLTPKQHLVSEKVSNIVISGSLAELTVIEVYERDGDRSEMIIQSEDPR